MFSEASNKNKQKQLTLENSRIQNMGQVETLF